MEFFCQMFLLRFGLLVSLALCISALPLDDDAAAAAAGTSKSFKLS